MVAKSLYFHKSFDGAALVSTASVLEYVSISRTNSAKRQSQRVVGFCYY